MSPANASLTAFAAGCRAPTGTGICSAWATGGASAPQIAVEKSRLELRICENAVRSIASPISSTMPVRRCWITETVIGSGAVMASSAARARRRPISHIRGGGAAATAGRGTSPVRIPFDRVRAEPESHAGTVGDQQLAVGHLDPFLEQRLEPRHVLGISDVGDRAAQLQAVLGEQARADRHCEIGRAHVWTPATHAHIVCRLRPE